MNRPRAHHHTTAFGAVLDEEIADAIRSGMALEAIYAELAARTRAVADQIVANHTRHLIREIEEARP